MMILQFQSGVKAIKVRLSREWLEGIQKGVTERDMQNRCRSLTWIYDREIISIFADGTFSAQAGLIATVNDLPLKADITISLIMI